MAVLRSGRIAIATGLICVRVSVCECVCAETEGHGFRPFSRQSGFETNSFARTQTPAHERARTIASISYGQVLAIIPRYICACVSV